MKKYKDYMPSDESEIEDLRKMQGPPTRDVALAKDRSWIDDIAANKEFRKKSRDIFSKVSAKKAKNAGDYGARMRSYDKKIEQADAEDDQAAADVEDAYAKGYKGGAQYNKALKNISRAFKKSVAKTKPLRKAAGGLVRGSGSARGVKPYKVC